MTQMRRLSVFSLFAWGGKAEKLLGQSSGRFSPICTFSTMRSAFINNLFKLRTHCKCEAGTECDIPAEDVLLP